MPDLRTIRNPAVYHGHLRKAPFFEGWYFKLVDAVEARRYAIIPGVFIGDGGEPGASHAFVQTLDGVTGRTAYHRYPFEAFQAARDTFDIHIGPNRFRVDELLLDIDRPEGQMRGKLRFAGLTPWPVTVSSPGVMGWYAYVPFMECYHGVLSLDHGISGALTVDGTRWTSAADAATSKKTGARHSPGHGSGRRATTLAPMCRGRRSRRPSRSFPGCGARSPASSWGCGISVNSTASPPTPRAHRAAGAGGHAGDVAHNRACGPSASTPPAGD